VACFVCNQNFLHLPLLLGRIFLKKIGASLQKQHGQASVFVILFSAILIVAAMSLFKAGKITTNKMQLQNAADAAAYSMSVVEARDLNFASYMNRAMVANEVGIAQFVGLASWAYHFQSFAQYIGFYNNCCLSPATLGASNAFIQPLVTAWQGPGQTAVRLMSKLANITTIVLHNINKIYGIASMAYHSLSVLFAVGVIDDVLEDNGPPGTELSDFGIVSLIGHIASYGVLPGLPGAQFATGYMPQSNIDVADFEESGYARLSAIIRDSRDPFSTIRDWRIPLIPTIDVETPHIPPMWVDLGFIAWETGFDFYLSFGLQRKGGAELRVLLPDSGNVKAGQAANWSSADATGMDMVLDIGGYARFYVLPEPFRQKIFDGSLRVSLGGGKLSIYIDLSGSDPIDRDDCEDANDDITADNDADTDTSNDLALNDCSTDAPSGKPILTIDPFPTEIPFASGFAEVGKTTNNDIKLADMALGGNPIEGENYGRAGENLIAWMFPGVGAPSPAPPTGIYFSSDVPAQTLTKSKVSTGYGGLPFYVDTKGGDPFLGVGAPKLLLGFIQKEADFNTYHLARTSQNLEDKVYPTANSQEPGGRLQVNEAFADDELAVLTKSELYFSRPTDVFASHFHRDDGLTEIGSAFNPYWSARLVDTNYAERTLALGVQQKEDYIGFTSALGSLTGKLQQIKDFIVNLNPF
jgi:hypothetical protein